MADYVSVLNKAIEGLSDNTVEARAEMYSKAQDALQRQLDALGDAMSPEQVDAQITALKDAVTEVEALHMPVPTPDELLAASLEDALGADLPDAAGEETVEAPKDDQTAEPVVEASETDHESEESVTDAVADDPAPAAAEEDVAAPEPADEIADDASETTESLSETKVSESEPEVADAAPETESEPVVEPDTETEPEPAAEAKSEADDKPAIADQTDEPEASAEPAESVDEPDAVEAVAAPDATKDDASTTDETDDPGSVLGELDALAFAEPNENADDLVDDLTDDLTEAPDVLTEQADPEDLSDKALATGAAAAAALGSVRPDSNLSFATKSRLDEAFGKAESKFSRPRPLAGEKDPMSRVQSAVADLEAEAERGGSQTSEVISLAEARSGIRPGDDAKPDGPVLEPGFSSSGTDNASDATTPAIEPVSDAANDTAPRMEDLRPEPIEIPTDGAGSKAWMVWLGVLFIVVGGGAYMYQNRDSVLPTLESFTERVRSIEGETPATEEPKIDDRVPGAESETATATEPEPEQTETTAETPAAPDTAETADGSETPAEGEPAPGGEVAANEDAVAGDAQDLPNPPIGSEYALLYEEGAGEGAADLRYGGGITWSVIEEPGANGTQETVLQARTTKPMNGLSLSIFVRKNTDQTLSASHTIDVVFAVPEGSPLGKIENIGGILLKASEPERGQPLIGAAAPVTDGFFIVGLSNAAQEQAINLQLLKERAWFDIPVLFSGGKRGIFTLAKGASGTSAFEQAFAAWGDG